MNQMNEINQPKLEHSYHSPYYYYYDGYYYPNNDAFSVVFFFLIVVFFIFGIFWCWQDDNYSSTNGRTPREHIVYRPIYMPRDEDDKKEGEIVNA